MKKTKQELLNSPIPQYAINLAKKYRACEEAIEWLEAKPRTLRNLVKQASFIEWFIDNVPVGRVYREILHTIYPSFKIWYQNGKLHRLDGPAVEYADGNKEWWQNGKCHRLDGPAVEETNGDKAWFQNGKLHRLDGPAIECSNGSKIWYQNGKLHRLDGPAIEYANGNKYWYKNGKFIRGEVK